MPKINYIDFTEQLLKVSLPTFKDSQNFFNNMETEADKYQEKYGWHIVDETGAMSNILPFKEEDNTFGFYASRYDDIDFHGIQENELFSTITDFIKEDIKTQLKESNTQEIFNQTVSDHSNPHLSMKSSIMFDSFSKKL